jgi:phosphoesterase RecJ-like protein
MTRTQHFLELLQSQKTVVVSSHLDPDGDSLGSVLALYQGLKQLNVEPTLLVYPPLAEKFSFLPDYDRIQTTLPQNLPKNKETLLITADVPNLSRLGFPETYWEEINPVIVNIDHHDSNIKFGDLVFFDGQASSTTEIIYDIFRDMKIPITKDCATCLYNGIVTDTGRFRFSNTSCKAMKIGAELLELGAEHHQIMKSVYGNFPLQKLQLENRVLSTLNITEGVASVYCTLDMVREVGYDDTEEVINKLTEIRGVKIALFFRESDGDVTKVSLRAVHDDANVNQIACSFGGGGHPKAAGAKIKQSLDPTMLAIREACIQHLEDIA